MFTGVFTKILVGIIGALFLSTAGLYVKYNWWDKPRLERTIADLQNANTELTVTAEKQQTEIDQLKTKTTIKRRVSDGQAKVDSTLGDSAAVVDFFRLRRKGSLPNPPDGGKGGPGPPTR